MPALIFDIDDTLYNQAEPFTRAYNDVFPGRFELDPEIFFKTSRRYSNSVFDAAQRGEITMEEMYIYRIKNALASHGLTVTDAEALAFQESYSNYQGEISMTPAMTDFLAECVAEGRTLGIITNGPAELQHKKIKALGADRFIPAEHTFISGEVGFSKPDVRIFALVQDRLNLKAKDTYFLGDTYVNDMLGAHRCGWHTLWFNRRYHQLPYGGFVPDFTVYTEPEFILRARSL